MKKWDREWNHSSAEERTRSRGRMRGRERTAQWGLQRGEKKGRRWAERGGWAASTERIHQLRRPCSEPWSSRATQTLHRPSIRPTSVIRSSHKHRGRDRKTKEDSARINWAQKPWGPPGRAAWRCLRSCGSWWKRRRKGSALSSKGAVEEPPRWSNQGTGSGRRSFPALTWTGRSWTSWPRKAAPAGALPTPWEACRDGGPTWRTSTTVCHSWVESWPTGASSPCSMVTQAATWHSTAHSTCWVRSWPQVKGVRNI